MNNRLIFLMISEYQTPHPDPGVDPDQDQRFVGPDLVPTCL